MACGGNWVGGGVEVGNGAGLMHTVWTTLRIWV